MPMALQGGGGVAGMDDANRHFADGGFINSSVPGRTDRIPTSVASDSYVIPADIVAGLGQGNSLAGAHIMDMILKTGPYGTPLTNYRPHANTPRAPGIAAAQQQYAKGGLAEKTPVVVAGGEYIVHPSIVQRLGGGSTKKGHELLDEFVLRMRKHNIKTQKKLAPPKK